MTSVKRYATLIRERFLIRAVSFRARQQLKAERTGRARKESGSEQSVPTQNRQKEIYTSPDSECSGANRTPAPERVEHDEKFCRSRWPPLSTRTRSVQAQHGSTRLGATSSRAQLSQLSAARLTGEVFRWLKSRSSLTFAPLEPRLHLRAAQSRA